MPDRVDVKEFRLVADAIADATSDDRALAITVAAYLDDYLGIAIRKRLPGLTADVRTALFGAKGPLGSTANKIDLARAMNIINTGGRSNLILINRIRNKFAHSIHVQTFDHPDVAELCAKFNIAAAREVIAPKVQIKDDPSNRELFSAVAIAYGAYIHSMLLLTGVPLAP